MDERTGKQSHLCHHFRTSVSGNAAFVVHIDFLDHALSAGLGILI